VTEQNSEGPAGGARARRGRIECPVKRELPAEVADIAYVKRDAAAYLPLIREIVILDVGQAVAGRDVEERLVRCGVNASIGRNVHELDDREAVERAIDGEVARVALLNVVDGGELSGKGSSGEAEAAGPIADAVAAADHLLVTETHGEANTRREVQ